MIDIKRFEKEDIDKVIAFEKELRRQEPDTYFWDIDEKYLTHTEPLAKDRYAEARRYIDGKEKYLEEQEKGASFISGDRIQHPIFGKGTILEVDMERGAYLIRFDEMQTFRSISIRAKLEKIDF